MNSTRLVKHTNIRELTDICEVMIEISQRDVLRLDAQKKIYTPGKSQPRSQQQEQQEEEEQQEQPEGQEQETTTATTTTTTTTTATRRRRTRIHQEDHLATLIVTAVIS